MDSVQDMAYRMGGDVDAKLPCRGIRTLKFSGCTRTTETRTRHALAEAGMVFVAELARMTEEQVLRLPLVGKTGLQGIQAGLSAVGLSLGTDWGDWNIVHAECAATETARRERIVQQEKERQAAEITRKAEFEAMWANPVRRRAFQEQIAQEQRQKSEARRAKLDLPGRVLKELRALRAAVARDTAEPTVVVERLSDDLLGRFEGHDGEWSFVDGVSLDGRVAITFSMHESERWRPRGYVVFQTKDRGWSDGSWHEDATSAVLDAVRRLC